MNNCKPSNDVYQEIINRFFHPQSYFYLCLRHYLEKLSVIRPDVAAPISRLLVQFIHFLSQSHLPVQTLQEVSHLSGFERFYGEIEQQLERMNFRALQQSQLRKALQDLAQNTLTRLVEILAANQSAYENLACYLDMRMKLQALLSGTSLARPVQPIAAVTGMPRSGASVEASVPDAAEAFGSLATTRQSTIDPVGEDESFAHFKQEIARLLKPFVIYSADAATQGHFIQKAQECFEEIETLAMYHGWDEVEAIAGKVARMMELVQQKNMPLDSQAIGIFYDAKAAIEKSVFHQHSSDNLKASLRNMNAYLVSLEQEDSAIASQPNESPFGVDLGRQITVSRALGSAENRRPTAGPEELPAERLPNITDSLADDYRAADDLVTLPAVAGVASDVAVGEIKIGELVEPAGGNRQFATDTLMVMAADRSKPSSPKQDVALMSEPSSGNSCDQFYHTIFVEEADRYFRLIARAAEQLKGQGKAQLYLEDIELASSAIKQLARKFGLEKIAFLPEIIETISWQANRSNVRPTLAVLELVEAGISLLQAYRPQNADHNLLLDQILSSLKEYYATTFPSAKRAATM